ncbi:MAG: hypothetical protein H0W62_06290 [Chitinophagales bacterium]|nr:hypothetical protein [Chitinophagales bacterium]
MIGFLHCTLAFAVFLGSASCKKNELISCDEMRDSSKELNGYWRVSQYSDNNQDKTNNFSAITVKFNNSYQFMMYENGIQQTEGSWSIKHGEDFDKLSIVIPFSDKPYKFFSSDWIITAKSSTSITLHNNTNEDEMMRLEKL